MQISTTYGCFQSSEKMLEQVSKIGSLVSLVAHKIFKAISSVCHFVSSFFYSIKEKEEEPSLGIVLSRPEIQVLRKIEKHPAGRGLLVDALSRDNVRDFTFFSQKERETFLKLLEQEACRNYLKKVYDIPIY